MCGSPRGGSEGGTVLPVEFKYLCGTLEQGTAVI